MDRAVVLNFLFLLVLCKRMNLHPKPQGEEWQGACGCAHALVLQSRPKLRGHVTVSAYACLACLRCAAKLLQDRGIKRRFMNRHAPRRLLLLSCRCAFIAFQFSVACEGLSAKASRPPSLAEWTADGNARARVRCYPLLAFVLPSPAACPAHDIHH